MGRAGRNPIRERWEQGCPAVGVSSRVPHLLVVESLARAGFDYVAIDCQHGATGQDSLTNAIAAVELGGSTPIVRVAANEPAMIQRALDLGGSGVIVPDVGSAEDAQAAADACRYPPAGRRSAGQIRGGFGLRADADREVLCIVMIETSTALDAIDAIVSVRGVDAVYFGTVDMALSLGIDADGGTTEQRLAEAMSRTVCACRRRGVVAGRPAVTPDDARQALEQGFQFVNVGADLEYVRSSAARDVAATRMALGLSPLE